MYSFSDPQLPEDDDFFPIHDYLIDFNEALQDLPDNLTLLMKTWDRSKSNPPDKPWPLLDPQTQKTILLGNISRIAHLVDICTEMRDKLLTMAFPVEDISTRELAQTSGVANSTLLRRRNSHLGQ